MKKTRSIFLLFILTLMASSARGQLTVVSGTVMDSDSRTPIAGAAVTMGSSAVVTNDDGFFTLKTSGVVDEIIVSHLGYTSQHLGVTTFSEQPLLVMLKPAAIQLQEVVVVSGDARELVLAAIDRIPDNYSRTSELLRCFYREMVMKRQSYISVSEGVVDVYKTDYRRGILHDRTAIRKGRRLMSARPSDTLSVKVMGGPTMALQLDIAKNPEFLLNADELDLYELRMEIPTTIADRRQYVVSLKPRADAEYALFFGRLYIDEETLAFTRAELELDQSDRVKATRAILVKKPVGLRFRPKEMSFIMDYRTSADGITRLSYLRSTIRFNCDWRRRLFATSFSAFCELAVTDTPIYDGHPIRGRDSFDQRDAFYDKVDFFYDPAFWEDYNIIEPTVTLDKAIDKLLKRKNN